MKEEITICPIHNQDSRKCDECLPDPTMKENWERKLEQLFGDELSYSDVLNLFREALAAQKTELKKECKKYCAFYQNCKKCEDGDAEFCEDCVKELLKKEKEDLLKEITEKVKEWNKSGFMSDCLGKEHWNTLLEIFNPQ